MSETVQDQAPASTDHPVTSIGKFPKWKRGIALLWVLSICGLSAMAGLVIAGFFGSMSGY
jgi:hypothetical protein